MCRPLILNFGMCLVLGSLCFCPRAVSGAINTIAISGQQAAGLPAGVQYGNGASSFYPMISSSGEVVFQAQLMGTGVTGSNNSAILAGMPGAINVVARSGDQAPGFPAGVVLSLGSLEPISSDGRITFYATLSGPGIDATNRNTFWRGRPGDLHLVARSGDPAPGTAPGVTFNNLDGVGSTILHAFLKGPGVTSQNDEGYWLVGDNGMTLLAREGDQAPGAPPGVNFGLDKLKTAIALNDMGRGAFLTTLTGPGVTSGNNGGVWYTDAKVTSLVARSGDPAPGAGTGVTYNLFGDYGWAIPTIGSGQVAFQTRLVGPGITGANDNSIWAGPPDNITLRVRDGQTAPGTNVPFSRLEQPHLNDAGDFAFASTLDSPNLDDESGIWLTHGGNTRLIARQGQVAPGSGGWFYTSFDGPLFAINSAGQVAFVVGLDPTSGYGSPSSGKNGIWVDNAGQVFRVVGYGDVLQGRTVQNAFFEDELGFNDLGQMAFVASFDSTGTNRGLFLYDPAVPEPSTFLIAACIFTGLIPTNRFRTARQTKTLTGLMPTSAVALRAHKARLF